MREKTEIVAGKGRRETGERGLPKGRGGPFSGLCVNTKGKKSDANKQKCPKRRATCPPVYLRQEANKTQTGGLSNSREGMKSLQTKEKSVIDPKNPFIGFA